MRLRHKHASCERTRHTVLRAVRWQSQQSEHGSACSVGVGNSRTDGNPGR